MPNVVRNDSEIFNFQQLTFGWTDYCLFGGLLAISLLIGLYFGIFRKQNNTNEYIFGGKTMGYGPVATSMLAGHVSGITLLGVPTEIYQHGASYLLVILTIIVTYLAVTFIFLPVFYKLQLPSTYEYLELRFSRKIRSLASFLYIVSLLMYIPLVVYVPALAFSQVTGYSLYTITPILCSICIVYTSIGGVRAVIWTDTIQFAFTIGGLLAVFYLGIQAVDGFSNAWKIAEAGKRTTIFDFNPSPFVRKSFWGMTISFTIQLIAHFGVGQNCVQRFLSIPCERDVRKAITLMGIGMIGMKVICSLTGILMFARYYDCDPLKAKILKRSDQILPYYVMDIAGHISGLPGIFLAGLVSCALSTMSAALNTLAGTIYDDFIDRFVPESENKEARATNIMKVISIIVGLIGMASVFIIEHLGTIFELSLSIRSVAEGPLLGFFVLGMIFPCVGRKGALGGAIISLGTMTWLVIGTQWNVYKKRIRHLPLDTSIENCPYPLNETSQMESLNFSEKAHQSEGGEEEEAFVIFKISMMHFTLIGTMIVIVFGLIISFITGEAKDTSKVDPDYITPFVRRFLRVEKYKEVPINEISGIKIQQTKDEDVILSNSENNDISKCK